MAQSSSDFVLGLNQYTNATALKLTRVLGSSLFGRTLKNLASSDSILITDLASCSRWLELAKNQAIRICENLSSVYVIPTILQAMNDCYYGEHKDSLIIYGPALKITLAFVADNVYKPKRIKPSRKAEDIASAVQAVFLFHQIYIVQSIFELYYKNEDYVEISHTGFLRKSENIDEVLIQYKYAFEKRGTLHRTLTSVSKAIWHNLDKIQIAIFNILEGQPAKEQDVFVDTLFEAIPTNANKKFWIGLLARVTLALLAAKHDNSGTNNLKGITIFGLPEGRAFPEYKDPKYKDIMEALFWTYEWQMRKKDNDAEHMIVEKPALLISKKMNLFATSFLAMADSLNWYVEASVLSYPDAGGVSLPNAVFQKTVSEPFEGTVCSIFRKYGFIAGRVTDRGIWRTDNKVTNLRSLSEVDIPGEIDVLAYSRDHNLVWVCECKVLSYPSSQKRMRNILSKLNETDTEGFHHKLESKTLWLTQNDFFHGENRFIQTLVLDRATPGMKHAANYMALDLIMLEDAIKLEIAQ